MSMCKSPEKINITARILKLQALSYQEKLPIKIVSCYLMRVEITNCNKKWSLSQVNLKRFYSSVYILWWISLLKKLFTSKRKKHQSKNIEIANLVLGKTMNIKIQPVVIVFFIVVEVTYVIITTKRSQC